jgi:serine/threonine protein kinase
MTSNSKYTNFHVDIWSLGILLYVMLQGTVPFKASTMEGLYHAQKRMDIQFPIDVSPEAENIIRRMLVLEPTQRLSLPELLSHPWLKNIIGPDGLPLEGESDEADDAHNFMMSLSFQRQECNLNPLSVVTGESRRPHLEHEVHPRGGPPNSKGLTS